MTLSVDTQESHSINDYSMLAHVVDQGGFDAVSNAVQNWLKNRHGFDIDVNSSGEHHSQNGQVSVLLNSGTNRTMRVQFEHESPTGAWSTEILNHAYPDRPGWVRLTVRNDQGLYAKVPALARSMARSTTLRDGPVPIGAAVKVLTQAHVPQLIQQLRSEYRRGLVFVAGTDSTAGIPGETWQKFIADVTKDVQGMAHAFLLDADATSAFNTALGNLGVQPWHLRTYYPEVRTDETRDSHRHPFLTPRTMARESNGHLLHMLGRVARRHANDRHLPGPVEAVRTRMHRLANERLFAAPVPPHPQAPLPRTRVVHPQATTTPAPTDLAESPSQEPLKQRGSEAAQLAAQQQRIRTLEQAVTEITGALGVSSDPGTGPGAVLARIEELRYFESGLLRVRSRVNDMQAHIEQLEIQKRDLEDGIEDFILENAELLESQRHHEARVRYLSSELLKHEAYESLAAEIPPDDESVAPENFAELLDRVGDLESQGVVFTGDAKLALGLDEHATLNSASAMAWDVLLTLRDYVRAKKEGQDCQGVDHYLKHTPPGYRQVPPNKHASLESQATMKQFGDLRMFAVPENIDGSGTATMQAHFKLAKLGMVSPRLYYLDTVNLDGNVYVGYIGPHLRNTQTN